MKSIPSFESYKSSFIRTSDLINIKNLRLTIEPRVAYAYDPTIAKMVSFEGRKHLTRIHNALSDVSGSMHDNMEMMGISQMMNNPMLQTILIEMAVDASVEKRMSEDDSMYIQEIKKYERA